MKIKIEKQPHGTVKIDLTTDTSRKPITMNLNTADLDSVIRILQMAKSVEVLKFELEL